LETFWCKVGGWSRSYHFGVNWRPWEPNTKSWFEYDRLTIFTTIRSNTRRPFSLIELTLRPAVGPREHFDPELRDIGGAWTDRARKGTLLCYAYIPADVFHSLCASGLDQTQEVVISILNFTRGHGALSDISLNPSLTDLTQDQ